MIRRLYYIFLLLACMVASPFILAGIALTDETMDEGAIKKIHAMFAEINLNNPELLMQRLQIFETAEQIEQAYGEYRPTVSLGINLSQNQLTQIYRGPGQTYQSRGYIAGDTSLTITQSLYEGGKRHYALNIAEMQLLAALRNLDAGEQRIFLDAVTGYLNLGRDKTITHLTQRNVARLTKSLEATKDRFSVGETTRTDISQAESRLASAVANNVESMGALETSKANYERIVGLSPDADLPLPDGANFNDLPNSLKGAIDIALQENPSILAAKYAVSEKEKLIKYAYTDHYPTVTLQGTASIGGTSLVGQADETHTLQALGSVSIPIYQQGKTSSKVRAAKYALRVAEQNLTKVERDIRNNVTTMWAQYESALAQVKARNSAVESAKIAYESIQEEANFGTRTIIDVLDAEQELLDAEVQMTTVARKLAVAYYSLLSSLGRLTVEKLGLDDPMHVIDAAAADPADLYDAMRFIDNDSE